MAFNPYYPVTNKIANLRFLDEFRSRPHREFRECDVIEGCGVYALYYFGPVLDYQVLVPKETGEGRPIYAGKAGPKDDDDDDCVVKNYLSSRLRKHERSITEARNLCIDDFRVRWIDLDSMETVETMEKVLIRTYRPLWNKVLTGFGNNDVGAGRMAQKKSRWDTLHPGRASFAPLAPNKLSDAEIRRRVALHLQKEAA